MTSEGFCKPIKMLSVVDHAAGHRSTLGITYASDFESRTGGWDGYTSEVDTAFETHLFDTGAIEN